MFRRRELQLAEIEYRVRRRMTLERIRLRDAENPFELPDGEFVKLYRVSKDVDSFLTEALGPVLEKRRSSGLTVNHQVLVALRFYASGGYQRGVGQDIFSSMSQASVSNCLRAVTDAICQMKHEWITFPKRNRERNIIQQSFRNVIPIPGIIGAIDYTHIAIVTPLRNEEGYKNHKGFYSLNVQMICDSSSKILNVSAYPGSVHDQFIWNYSPAKTVMKATHDERQGRYYLLGDSGYALEPWLLTPLPHAEDGTPERRYTQAHCRARSVVERLFGVLKGRWRCLLRDRVLHYQPGRASKMVMACAVLHNIMLHHKMPLLDIDFNNEDDILNHIGHGERLAVARRYQAEVIENHFR